MPDNHPKPLPTLTQKDVDRFWTKIDKTPGQGPTGECWGWTASTFRNGYGQFKIRRKPILRNLKATRIAYFLATGIDPYPFNALHTCDWPPCCNDTHLFVGTNAENSEDMVHKGRSAKGNSHGWHTHPERVPRGNENGLRKHPESVKRGQDNGAAKFATATINLARDLHAGGYGYAAITKQTGISRTHLYRIFKGQIRVHC